MKTKILPNQVDFAHSSTSPVVVGFAQFQARWICQGEAYKKKYTVFSEVPKGERSRRRIRFIPTSRRGDERIQSLHSLIRSYPFVGGSGFLSLFSSTVFDYSECIKPAEGKKNWAYSHLLACYSDYACPALHHPSCYHHSFWAIQTLENKKHGRIPEEYRKFSRNQSPLIFLRSPFGWSQLSCFLAENEPRVNE